VDERRTADRVSGDPADDGNQTSPWRVLAIKTREESKMINSSFGILLAVSVGVWVPLISTHSLADERCRQLEALHAKYAGVQLTPDEKVLKVKLVAWYSANCGKHEVPDVSPTALSAAR
jgi:hypothetical protein